MATSSEMIETSVRRSGRCRNTQYRHGAMPDGAAIWAAITSPRSNDQTEGQIATLKLVKR
jgi:transposase